LYLTKKSQKEIRMAKVVLCCNYGIGNQLGRIPLIKVLKRNMCHEICVLSEYVGLDAIQGHPAIDHLIRWFPGNRDYENQMLAWIDNWKPDVGIAAVPVHGDSATKFIEKATHSFSYGKIETWEKHEAAVNLDYARQLGWDGPEFVSSEFFIPDDIEEAVKQQASREFGDAPMFGFHFGCIKNQSWVYKRWHLERFIELMTRLHEETGGHILITGSQMERDEADQVKFSLDENIRPYLVDVVGRSNLKETGAMMRQCDVFISNDSGPMHMAAALEVPVVAIFGMSNPVKNGPWVDPTRNDRARVLYDESLWCRPCYGSNRHGMCQRGDCLVNVSVDTVFDAAMELYTLNKR
jgi:ADP-heptose:LPS heptosyltransferase